MDNDGLVPAFGPVHVDTVKAYLSRVSKSVQRWESSERVCAEDNAITETLYEMKTIKRWEVERFRFAGAVSQGREETWERRRIEPRLLWIV